MKKEYLKPEIEYIDLTVSEVITDDDLVDGEMGIESSIF